MSKNKPKSKPVAVSTNESVKNSPKTSLAIAPPSFLENPYVVYGLLALSVLIAYVGSFGNDFTMSDDNIYVTENYLVLSPSWANMLKIWSVEVALNYHPLTMTSLALNTLLFGSKATSFIITNVIIHLCNTLLIYQFTRQLTNNNVVISFLTALLWGVHPLHVESVAWIAERKDVLYTFFFFLGCIFYVRYLRNENLKNYLLVLLFFILSCLSKGMAVVLPLVLVLIDYWLDKEPLSRKRIVEKIPFVVISMIFGVLAIHIQSGGNLNGLLTKITIGTAIGSTYTFVQRFLFGFYGFLIYIFKLFIPINQRDFYNYPYFENYYNIEYLLSPVAAFFILGGAALLYRRQKIIFFGVLFFFATIVTVLQFISVGASMLAERYSYIPSFGLIFMVVYLLNQWLKSRTLIAVGSLIAIIFIVLTYKQTKVYKNGGTLLENTFKYEPTAVPVNEFLATYFGRHGEPDKVIKHGEIAMQGGDKAYGLLMYIGNAHIVLGNPTKSLPLFDQALQSAPLDKKGEIYYNRAVAHQALGNYPQAVSDYSDAMKYNPGNPNGHLVQRAFSYLQNKQYKEAIVDYTKLISLKIAVDTAYNDRAVAKFSVGDREGAIQDLHAALKINPNYQDVHNNLKKLGLE